MRWWLVPFGSGLILGWILECPVALLAVRGRERRFAMLRGLAYANLASYAMVAFFLLGA